MTLRRTFPLTSAEDSRDAQVYYGHLVSQAESQLGAGADPIACFALTWLAGDGISRSNNRRKILIESLFYGDQPLGTWTLRIRSVDCEIQPIELYRKQFLAEDGRQMLDLAAPFIENEDPETLDAFCIMQLARLCATNSLRKQAYTLIDSEGHRIEVEMHQASQLPKSIRELFVRASRFGRLRHSAPDRTS